MMTGRCDSAKDATRKLARQSLRAGTPHLDEATRPARDSSYVANERLKLGSLSGPPHRPTALEQPVGCQRVATLDRANPSGAQQLRCSSRQTTRPLVVPA